MSQTAWVASWTIMASCSIPRRFLTYRAFACGSYSATPAESGRVYTAITPYWIQSATQR